MSTMQCCAFTGWGSIAAQYTECLGHNLDPVVVVKELILCHFDWFSFTHVIGHQVSPVLNGIQHNLFLTKLWCMLCERVLG